MTNPKFNIGQVVYLRESAALGFLEASKISGAHLGQNGWLYSVNSSFINQSPSGNQMDRHSLVSTQIVYYNETEFITLCDALVLVEANATAALARAVAQRQALCPELTEQ